MRKYDGLSNFETLNSNDALRSKHHAVWETISRKEKLPITRKLSNASNGTDAAEQQMQLMDRKII